MKRWEEREELEWFVQRSSSSSVDFEQNGDDDLDRD